MATRTASSTRSVQRIIGRNGAQLERSLPCPDSTPGVGRTRTIADQVQVALIMSHEITCARRDLEATRVLEILARSRVGCVPVVDDRGRPAGMITKLDLVEQLFAVERGKPEDEHATPCFVDTASDLMMPLAITLAEHATVAHAVAVMAREAIHHVPIVDLEGCLIGVVSSMDIVRWLASNDGVAAELDDADRDAQGPDMVAWNAAANAAG
jgi:CBS domain-containing protein